MVRISKLSRPIPRWFTFRPMIPGWFTAIQSWPGRDGIRTRESGLAVRIFRSVSASESAGLAVSDGAGDTGDLTGTTTTLFTTTAGIIRIAGRSITGATSAAADLSVAQLSTAESEHGRSRAIARRRADMRPPAVRAVYAQALSAATIMAESRAVMRHADDPASEAAEAFTAVVADMAAAGVTKLSQDDRTRKIELTN